MVAHVTAGTTPQHLGAQQGIQGALHAGLLGDGDPGAAPGTGSDGLQGEWWNKISRGSDKGPPDFALLSQALPVSGGVRANETTTDGVQIRRQNRNP